MFTLVKDGDRYQDLFFPFVPGPFSVPPPVLVPGSVNKPSWLIHTTRDRDRYREQGVVYTLQYMEWCREKPIIPIPVPVLVPCSVNEPLSPLRGNRTRTGTGNRTGTIGNNRHWTSVNISTWYCNFHLVPVPIAIRSGGVCPGMGVSPQGEGVSV